MARKPDSRTSLPAAMERYRADYEAARSSRFQRKRTGVAMGGAAADYHYRSEADYLRIMEYARDMDRNDAIVGQMVDRAVANTLQGGMMPRPRTGDDGLNQELLARFNEWASDPLQADASGYLTFWEQQGQALRSSFIDGDIFYLPLDDGPLQAVEAHRCRTAKGTVRNVVHGVLLDDRRRPVEYWFTKDDIGLFDVVQKVGDVERYPAFDDDGRPLVFHLKHPKRATQTRGVTALAPVFNVTGMFEDIQFSKLVQQQIVSCIAFIRKRDEGWNGVGGQQYGDQREEMIGGTRRLIEELAPGMEIEGEPGETIEGFSPQVPNSEFFQHARMTLQLIGINLGMPLVLLLMDASETNFSGWRGAVDQAKLGFRENQRRVRDHFCRHVWQWKVAQFVADDPAMRRAAAARDLVNDSIYRHEWHMPGWPYVQPLEDARADSHRIEKLMASRERISGERGIEFDREAERIVANNAKLIASALAERKRLLDEWGEELRKHGETLHWREVLYLGSPDEIEAQAELERAEAQKEREQRETADEAGE